MRVLLIVATLLHPFASQAAESAKPPPELARMFTHKRCTRVQWDAVDGGHFTADCVNERPTRRDGVERQHDYYFCKLRPSGSFAVTRLFGYRETESPRAKNPLVTQVVRTGTKLVSTRQDTLGWVQIQTWDLTGPVLREERVGGRKICREGFSDYVSELAEAVCVTDFVARRTRCRAEQPDCRGDPSAVKEVSYVAIPRAMPGNTKAAAKLAGCAAVVGTQPDDTVVGVNHAGTTFQVAAIDDPKAQRLTLVMRANDATPTVSADATRGGKQQDHFEVWLASGQLAPRCADVVDLDAFCRDRLSTMRMLGLQVLPKAGGGFTVVLAQPDPASPADTGPGFPPHEALASGKAADVVLELRGMLYTWAQQGGITVGYWDAPSGETASQGGLFIATSTVMAGRPELLGRLGEGGDRSAFLPCLSAGERKKSER